MLLIIHRLDRTQQYKKKNGWAEVHQHLKYPGFQGRYQGNKKNIRKMETAHLMSIWLCTAVTDSYSSTRAQLKSGHVGLVTHSSLGKLRLVYHCEFMGSLGHMVSSRLAGICGKMLPQAQQQQQRTEEQRGSALSCIYSEDYTLMANRLWKVLNSLALS